MQLLGKDGLKALIRLLETESDTYGPVLKRALADAIKTNPDEVQRVMEEEFQTSVPRTVLNTLEEICWEDLAAALARFAAKINPDLEEGLMLLSKFTSPVTARGDVNAPLDHMAAELRPVLLNAKNCTEIAAVLGHYFFRLQQITALQTNLDIKDISFARFLRKKTRLQPVRSLPVRMPGAALRAGRSPGGFGRTDFGAHAGIHPPGIAVY